MSSEEVFVQQFATLFIHYRHALTLESVGENGAELRELGDLPIVEPVSPPLDTHKSSSI